MSAVCFCDAVAVSSDTHINSKYSSEAISKMFENSLPYKAYWAVSIFSIVSLIVFGVLTLVVTGEEVRRTKGDG